MCQEWLTLPLLWKMAHLFTSCYCLLAGNGRLHLFNPYRRRYDWSIDLLLILVGQRIYDAFRSGRVWHYTAQLLGKRVIDILGAGLGIFLFSPIMLGIAAHPPGLGRTYFVSPARLGRGGNLS